ncbi:MAG: hypothetical protein WCD07_12840 [Burkholderiales bacterium]
MAVIRFGLLVIAGLFWTPCLAEPLVTIACHEPKGSRMEYGASARERVRAEIDKKSEPKPQLRGPTKDGYDMNPTFVVDSGKKKLTVTWSESASDVKLRKQLKAANLPAPSLPPTVEADIVLFEPDQISALQVTPPNAVTMYSFFPKLGTAFFTTQAHELSGKNSQQMSVFSACEFSWNRPR